MVHASICDKPCPIFSSQTIESRSQSRLVPLASFLGLLADLPWARSSVIAWIVPVD